MVRVLETEGKTMNALFERVQRSWQLLQSSLQVMREHPKLLIFPIITAFLTMIIALFFLVPVVGLVVAKGWLQTSSPGLSEQWANFFKTGNTTGEAIGFAIMAVIYILSMALATFFNTAFYSQILAALNGREVTVRNGFEAARARLPAILMWSLLAGIVGIIIRWIEEKLSFVGRIIAGFIGLAWSVAAIFAIPILVREPDARNPFQVLSRSAQTIKRTWGEALIGYVGLQGMGAVVFCISVASLGIAGAAAYLVSPWLGGAIAVAWLLSLIAYSYLADIASKVYLCALYIYSTEGVVPTHYSPSLMDTAWKVKKS